MSNKKKFILEAAYTLFLQNSFKAVTMNEIIQASNVSTGSFYYYFKSKEDVFKEVVNQYFIKLLDLNFHKFSQTSLLAFYTDYLKDLTNSDYFRNLQSVERSMGFNFYSLFFEAIRVLPDFNARCVELHNKEVKAWIAVIKTAKEKKEIRTDLSDERVADLFIYVNDGVGIHTNILKLNSAFKAVWDSIYSLLTK